MHACRKVTFHSHATPKNEQQRTPDLSKLARRGCFWIASRRIALWVLSPFSICGIWEAELFLGNGKYWPFAMASDVQYISFCCQLNLNFAPQEKPAKKSKRSNDTKEKKNSSITKRSKNTFHLKIGLGP